MQQEFELDPFSPNLFVFCNRGRDKLKILHWDQSCFWLYYHRLKRGKFHWPSDDKQSIPLKINRRQLRWLLDGLSLEQKQAHSVVTARTIL